MKSNMTNKEKPHLAGWGRTRTAETVVQSDYTPIFSGTRVVGVVKGETFFKSIKKNHFLQIPPAIAFDIDSLEQAENSGAVKVQVTDKDSGTVYRSNIRHIYKHGQRFNRGHGDQIFLVLEGWTKSSKPRVIQLRLLTE